ncbi:MAG: GFA family protein [Stappiaceae bacterium]
MTGSDQNNQTLKGQCLCGEIEFECAHPGEPITICHCVQCRQWGGSPWAATSVPVETFKVTRGESALKWFVSSNFARRGFCRTCGSSLFWHADRHPDWSSGIAISAGCLKEPTRLSVARHIWCKSKGDYYTIEGDLPQDLEE